MPEVIISVAALGGGTKFTSGNFFAAGHVFGAAALLKRGFSEPEWPG